MRVSVVRGDITERKDDAIVNAANSSLGGGGGVDGAIHRSGGPAILQECRRIRAEQHPEGLPVGQAVATTAGNLPCRHVIHTVGPVYARSQDPATELASCHREALRVADEVGATSVAFPAISCGIYGYPVEEAASIAVGSVLDADTEVEEVTFVLFDDRAHEAFEAALAARTR